MSVWTPENVELLKKLWAEGLSASQCATRLAAGISRNAVIGKVTRLGINRRSSTQRVRYTRSPNAFGLGNKKQNRPAMPGVQPSRRGVQLDVDPFVPAQGEVVIPREKRKTIQTLESDDCRWPIGDPLKPDFHFCGKPKIFGLPYCDHHARRAYQPIPLSVRAPTRTRTSTVSAPTEKEDA